MTGHWLSRLALVMVVWLQPLAKASQPPTGQGRWPEPPPIWAVLALDPKGDTASPSAVDAAQLSYHYDRDADVVWFRVALYGSTTPDAFGLQLAVDSGSDDAAKTSWWGANKDFRFDRLLTVRVTRKGGAYSGTVGIADADGARAGALTNLARDNLYVRSEGDAIVLGVRRADLAVKTKMNAIAAVGSIDAWTDEIPNTRPLAIDFDAARPARGLREIDVRRNNLALGSDYEPLPDDQPPVIVRRGAPAGRAVILIPGVFSGDDVFDPFIARHDSAYRFYIVTPPGLNGTRARAMPRDAPSYGSRPWTRRLEQDVLELIRRERLEKPVIVSHGYPGSFVATALAADHPEAIGGAIEIAAMPVRPMPSPKDPTGKTFSSPEERAMYVDMLWAPKWFKYVTDETWESNNYPAAIFENDPDRAEQTRRRIEQTPLAVKARYLMESNATDDSADIARIATPLLAVRPGFTAAVLADPVSASAQGSFVDAWTPFARNPNIRLVTIPGACVRVFHDQPDVADQVIASFVERLNDPRVRR